MNYNRLFVWKSHWNSFGGSKHGSGRVSGNHQGKGNNVSQLMEIQIWHLPMPSAFHLPSSGEGSVKKQYLLPAFSCDKAVPPVIALNADNSLLPCMALLPVPLLPQCCSSEQVSPKKLMRESFKKNICVSRNLPSDSARTPAGFYSKKWLWRLLLPAQEHWAGEPGVGLGSFTLLGDLHSWNSSLDFQPLHMGIGPAYSTYLPLLPFTIWLLLYIHYKNLFS